MKKNLRLLSLLSVMSAMSFFSCSQDEHVANENQTNSEIVTSAKNADDWRDYVKESADARPDNSIVFNSQAEYDDFVKKLHETINNAQDSELLLEYSGENVSARGCADGVYYGSGMTSGFATLGFDVTVAGGCITGVSGSFSGMTLGVSYSQGGTSIGCKSATVCGNVNYNFFLEGIGTVYSQRVCYKLNLGC